MFTNIISCVVLTVVLGPTALLGQSKPSVATSTAGLELPARMRQNVEAGKTPVGAKVQAKLDIATLVNGVVVPEDAILSGEVIESVAKSATAPSRLAIRMDSAQWKNGSATVALPLASKVYLTAWYYPALPPMSQNPEIMPDASHSRTQHPGGSAPYPDPNTPASPPPSHALQHRVPMKDVESVRNGDGAVTLTSRRSNLKLDKSTTYVLATGNLLTLK
jgi:hypothetical protein